MNSSSASPPSDSQAQIKHLTLKLKAVEEKYSQLETEAIELRQMNERLDKENQQLRIENGKRLRNQMSDGWERSGGDSVEIAMESEVVGEEMKEDFEGNQKN